MRSNMFKAVLRTAGLAATVFSLQLAARRFAADVDPDRRAGERDSARRAVGADVGLHLRSDATGEQRPCDLRKLNPNAGSDGHRCDHGAAGLHSDHQSDRNLHPSGAAPGTPDLARDRRPARRRPRHEPHDDRQPVHAPKARPGPAPGQLMPRCDPGADGAAGDSGTFCPPAQGPRVQSFATEVPKEHCDDTLDLDQPQSRAPT